jgi:hypothetical protein
VRINPMLDLGECNYQLSFKCLEFDFFIQDWGPYCRRFWILVLADQAGSLTNLLQICNSCLKWCYRSRRQNCNGCAMLCRCPLSDYALGDLSIGNGTQSQILCAPNISKQTIRDCSKDFGQTWCPLPSFCEFHSAFESPSDSLPSSLSRPCLQQPHQGARPLWRPGTQQPVPEQGLEDAPEPPENPR